MFRVFSTIFCCVSFFLQIILYIYCGMESYFGIHRAVSAWDQLNFLPFAFWSAYRLDGSAFHDAHFSLQQIVKCFGFFCEMLPTNARKFDLIRCVWSWSLPAMIRSDWPWLWIFAIKSSIKFNAVSGDKA